MSCPPCSYERASLSATAYLPGERSAVESGQRIRPSRDVIWLRHTSGQSLLIGMEDIGGAVERQWEMLEDAVIPETEEERREEAQEEREDLNEEIQEERAKR